MSAITPLGSCADSEWILVPRVLRRRNTVSEFVTATPALLVSSLGTPPAAAQPVGPQGPAYEPPQAVAGWRFSPDPSAALPRVPRALCQCPPLHGGRRAAPC